ncbi:hypothetical protein [Ferroplasma sp.]|uniref:hypothetical protein n=1 Tax=Ferroplasma sp. TaxID=2591003 RepID=UPI002636E67B|nr:hypothetical protein [Ferroplasma sp.]
MNRDDDAAINVLNAELKNIFSDFIIIRPGKIRHKKKRMPGDSGEFMPVDGKPVPDKASFSIKV